VADAASGSTAGSGSDDDARGGSTTDGGGQSGGGESGGCEAPDVLVVLDRTLSMSRSPDGTKPADTAAGHRQTKWYKAITGIKQVVETLDQTVRFGLELFPRDPGNDSCVTLSENLQGKNAVNPSCQGGELVIPPAIDSSMSFDDKLDPETTLLCISTPIGAALETANEILTKYASPVRSQYVLLLTDGRDTCADEPALPHAHALAKLDVKTHVVGFDGSGKGIDHGNLNDLACAGRTAPNFPDGCQEDGEGQFTAMNREGATLYNLVTDGDQLAERLKAIAGAICCGCVI
jgi:hypothetical protein